MSETIEYKERCDCLGRNGYMHMVALQVERWRDVLCLAPVTSRRTLGRAYVSLPVTQAAEVANAILKEAGITLRVTVNVRGGVAEAVDGQSAVTVEITDHDNLEAEQDERRRRVA